MEKYIGTKEAAEYAGQSERTIRDWVAAGIIPALKPNGKTLLFTVDDIDAALRARAVKPKQSGEGAAE